MTVIRNNCTPQSLNCFSANSEEVKREKLMSTLKIVKRKPECLGEFVRRIRDGKGLSLSDVSKQSALSGSTISASYINRIERNPKVKVTADKLKALAHGLGIPVEEMLAHAVREMSRDEADELSLLTRYRELSPERKSDVWDLIELFRNSPQQNLTNH